MYEDLSITLFVSGYLAIMETLKSSFKHIMAKHLKELMADAEVYGWAPVGAYHAVWIQQIKNSQAQWTHVDAKLEFRRTLVWHAASQVAQPKSDTGGGGRYS